MSVKGSVKVNRHPITHATAPFSDLEVVDLVTDGLQVALLGQPRQQSLHAVVELLFAVELEGKKKGKRLQLKLTK